MVVPGTTPAGTTRLSGSASPTRKVSLTAAVPVLTKTARLPLRVTPGTLRAMAPLIRPASTPPFEISRAVPLLRVAIGLAPPRLMLTFVRATRTTGCGAGPVVVALSKAMSPRMVWPRTPRVTPTPSTRR